MPSEVSIDIYERREDWLKARQTGIGGSDAPTAMGEGYQSPVEWWMRKTGRLPALDDSRRFRYGHFAEPFISREAEAEMETTFVDPGDFTIFRDGETPWRFATVDRFASNGQSKTVQLPAHPKSAMKALVNLRKQGYLAGPVEMKTVTAYLKEKWEEGPPVYAWIQLQHTLAVLDMEQGWIVGLVGAGEDLHLYHCERDDDFQGELLEAEERLWKHVTDDTPPPVDGLESTRKALEQLYPSQQEGSVIQLNPADWQEAIETRAKLKEAEKAVKEDLKAIDNALKAEMKSAERCEIPGVAAFTWKAQRRVDPPRLEERVSEFRVFREAKL